MKRFISEMIRILQIKKNGINANEDIELLDDIYFILLDRISNNDYN